MKWHTYIIIVCLVLAFGIFLGLIIIGGGKATMLKYFQDSPQEIEGSLYQVGMEAVTSGIPTYTQEGKTICSNGKCTWEQGAYIQEGKDWVDWKQAKSLKKDGRFKIVYLKNDSGTWLDILDFNSTSTRIQACINSTFSLKDVPLNITGAKQLSFQNIKIPAGCYNVTLPISLIGRQIKFGSKSTIITITNPSGFNIKYGDNAVGCTDDDRWMLDSEKVIIVTINTSSIPADSIINSVEFAGMSGVTCVDAPTCTADEINTAIDASGIFGLTNSSRYDSYGDGCEMFSAITGTTRTYVDGNVADYRTYFAPGSTEWGGITGYPAVGFNSTQWLMGNSDMNADVQSSLASDEFSFGIKSDGFYWNENTPEPPQNAIRLRITYTEAVNYNITTCPMTITVTGNYRLNNSILNVAGSPCIDIQVDDVDLDLNQKTIDGDDGSLDSAIITTTGATKTNVTIHDGYISDWGVNIYGGSTIRNIKITSPPSGFTGVRTDGGVVLYDNVTVIVNSGATGKGFYLGSATSIFINNSLVNTSSGTATSSSMYGLWMSSAPTTWTLTNSRFDNIGAPVRSVGTSGNIYNNYFNTQSDPSDSGGGIVQNWNTTLTASPNIFGGSYIGGNYWARIGATNGKSENCVDLVSPFGICDTAFTFAFGDWDYLPLSSNSTDLTDPSISWLSPTNNSYLNGNILLWASASDDFGIYSVNFSYKNASASGGYTQIAVDTGFPYQTLLGTSSIGSDDYFFEITAKDNNGRTNSTYLTINIDKSVPIATATLIYPTGQSSVRNGQNISLNLNVTDGAGAGINNSKVEIRNLNMTTGNVTMKFIGGSNATGQYSSWQLNVSINNHTGVKSVPYYIFDLAIPNNVQRGSVFSVEVDNDNPTWSSLNHTPLIPNNGDTVTFYINSLDNYALKYINFSSNVTGAWVNETIAGVAGTSFYASKDKTLASGNYSYMFNLWDDAGNYNQTSIQNIEVIGVIATPEILVYNPYPNNNHIYSGSGGQNFSYYYINGNATNCSLVWDGNLNQTLASPINNTAYNFTIPTMEIATHTWNIECVDNNTLNQILGTDKTLYVQDPFYPVFSAYSDNNGTQTTRGNATINITISNSNGTAFLEFASVNYSASNYSFNKFNITIYNISEGAYTYYWGSWGNGTSNLYNISDIREYTINETPIAGDTTPPYFNPIPLNQTFTFNADAGFDVNATDETGLSCYTINDTRFSINCSGWVTNTTVLGVMNYGVNISANDTSNNWNSTYLNINISIASRTVYAWIAQARSNYAANNNTAVNIFLNATRTCEDGRLYSNGTEVAVGTFPLYNVTNFTYSSSFNITSLCKSNQNYSQASETWFAIISNYTAPAPPSNATGVSAIPCRYKKYGYWNKYLPWMKQEGCI